ncbi:AraC family transcriptional regulator [Streptomyces sp. NPDC005813]|uniref:AraC family transcriptional regulator n=1 Tax=Streptomyces sp. NPDC005813 TaxID=3155592 RepID=UPI0033E4CCBE
MNWDLPRPPTSMLEMTRLAAQHGVPAETCLAGTGVRPEQLLLPEAEVTARQELTLVGNMLDALGHPPGLGIEAGQRYHLTTYGIWGFALVSSPTLRNVIDVALRFVDLSFSLGNIKRREEAGNVELVLDAPDVPPSVRRFFVERDAVGIMTIQRELFASPVPFRRVDFAFPPPADGVGLYSGVFGVPPAFDAQETVIGLDPGLLDLPLPQANEHTAALALAQCRELLARRRARTGLAGRVRDVLVARLSDPPDADEVADLLHLGSRTLRHRLAAEDTSYRALLSEVREHMAEELLITAGLPVEQIARRLGYVEVSSFSQAFRRWKGVGPREYRRQHPALGR